MNKLFDLNIEEVLEHWEPEHAFREIIANALDEKALTKTDDIKIYKDNSAWHVRDFGRGVHYKHFTQNENIEKLQAPNLIGKFGVGLKDALAVFYRNNISVEIRSKFATINLTMAKKPNFNINTLHAEFSSTKDTNMVGTDVVIKNINDESVEKAKSMFLAFNEKAKLLEKTKYGEVYSEIGSDSSFIYINGVKVAEEGNFLFSYNITNIDSKIKKAINRERSNVGRTAYAETVKKILLNCKGTSVLSLLVEDLENIMKGTNRDESSWVGIASYAAETINKENEVVFMTPEQRANMTNQQVEILEQSGKKMILVTENVFSKIKDHVITDKDIYDEYNERFAYEFVDYKDLTPQEKGVFDCKNVVISFLKEHNYKYRVKIRISETIFMDELGRETFGVFDNKQNCIIIKRSALEDRAHFLGVLIHEFAHFTSGYQDNTRDFENILTEMLGYAMDRLLNEKTNTD